MRVTLREIAQHTNVHLSTVSHVLNGAAGSTRVSATTRRRVLEAAAELGYTPNRAAQQLRGRSSHIVGLLTGGLENPFFARMVSLCSEALERKGYDVVLAVRRADEANDLHLLRALSTRQVDGILLWSETITEVRERVQQPDMSSTIVMGYPISGRDCVAASLQIGVEQALHHLVSRGCSRIAYMAPAQSLRREGDPRFDIYNRFIREANRPPIVIAYEGSAFNVEAARRRAEQVAASEEVPDGLLCFNDMVAIGAFMGFRRASLRVPKDIAIVGCDDLPLSAQLDIPLTTIHYPMAEMCRIAVDMLMERVSMAGESEALTPRLVELPTELRIRESSLK